MSTLLVSLNSIFLLSELLIKIYNIQPYGTLGRIQMIFK